MKTNAPYQARELADQAAYMGAVALSEDAGMTAEARMELIDALADNIAKMAASNAEHWKRIIQGERSMKTLSDSDCRRILAAIAGSNVDPVHAAAQAVAFFEACREQDSDYWQYAANPDLVDALGTSADVFLGWR